MFGKTLRIKEKAGLVWQIVVPPMLVFKV